MSDDDWFPNDSMTPSTGMTSAAKIGWSIIIAGIVSLIVYRGSSQREEGAGRGDSPVVDRSDARKLAIAKLEAENEEAMAERSLRAELEAELDLAEKDERGPVDAPRSEARNIATVKLEAENDAAVAERCHQAALGEECDLVEKELKLSRKKYEDEEGSCQMDPMADSTETAVETLASTESAPELEAKSESSSASEQSEMERELCSSFDTSLARDTLDNQCAGSSLKSNFFGEPSQGTVVVKLVGLHPPLSISLEVNFDDLVVSVKQQCNEQLSAGQKCFDHKSCDGKSTQIDRLTFCGLVLKDGFSLRHYGVKENSVILAVGCMVVQVWHNRKLFYIATKPTASVWSFKQKFLATVGAESWLPLRLVLKTDLFLREQDRVLSNESSLVSNGISSLAIFDAVLLSADVPELFRGERSREMNFTIEKS